MQPFYFLGTCKEIIIISALSYQLKTLKGLVHKETVFLRRWEVRHKNLALRELIWFELLPLGW